MTFVNIGLHSSNGLYKIKIHRQNNKKHCFWMNLIHSLEKESLGRKHKSELFQELVVE